MLRAMTPGEQDGPTTLSTTERAHPPVVLDGEIDMATAGQLTAALREPLAVGGPVVVDLSQVTFIDSTGLRTLYDAAQALEGRGCLILHGVNSATERVLSLIQIGDVPNIHIVGCHLLSR